MCACVCVCVCPYNRRVRGDPYYELMDEFLTAVRRRYGNTTLIQFKDMTYENASKLLNMYRYAQHRRTHLLVCIEHMQHSPP